MHADVTLKAIAEIWKTPIEAKRYPIEIPNVDRESLAELFGVLGMKLGAEIGVERGVYAETLLKHSPRGGHLLCVDAWEPYSGYRDHKSVEKLQGFYEETKARLAQYYGHATIIRKFSVEAARNLRNGSLDYVYIDANHSLQSVIQDLDAWVPKVRSGGIVAGHDYSQRVQNGYQVHVVEALRAWTGAYHVKPWFVLGTKDIVEGERRDRPRSWFWVVP